MSIAPPRLRILQGILISPAIGIAATILPIFFLSRNGLPVKDFAEWLIPALGACSLLVLILRKPIIPWRHIRWFSLVLFIAALLVGWPMLKYGFDWISYANDDMANYCLAAQRFFNHGFFDPPNLNDLFTGKDYSQSYWFMHVLAGTRSGSELILAAIWSLTGLNAHKIFMPVILALHLSLISSGAALVAGPVRSAKAPLIAAGLLAISPLTALGTLYQLIGQVGGLALLSAVVVLLYRKVSISPVKRLFRGSISGVIVLGALFICYPEVLPFVGLGWFLYLVLSFRQKGVISSFSVIMPILLFAAIFVMPFNYKLIVSIFKFMLIQANSGMEVHDIHSSIFPYFLVPSGIPALFGIIPIAGDYHGLELSGAIAAGLLTLAWTVYKVLSQAKAGSPASAIALVMLLLWVILFARNNDFGLFKLSMYIQPFLITTVAYALATWQYPQQRWLAFCVIIVLIFNIGSQFAYTRKSTGEAGSGLSEVPYGSSKKINHQFSILMKETKKNKFPTNYIADTTNIVIEKFQSLYSLGENLYFPSRLYFTTVIKSMNGISPNSAKLKYSNIISEFNLQKQAKIANETIDIKGNVDRFEMQRFMNESINKKEFIITSETQDIFNFSQKHITSNSYFLLEYAPNNHLVFINSSLGNHYYFGHVKKISFYQLEWDPMMPGRLISGLGRYILMNIWGPTKNPRMVMEITNTVLKQFQSKLPHPVIQGKSAVPLQIVGRGSARVFSSPLVLKNIDGSYYLAIDMGRDGQRFPFKRTGLMSLYGLDVPMDRRLLTTFGRDISLISDADYRNLQPPRSLSVFPKDLENTSLEYSGIYEDGWVSEQAYFVLGKKLGDRFLLIKGMIPQIGSPDFSTNLTLSFDGKKIADKNLGLGNFEIKVPVSPDTQRHRIDLAFSHSQALPGEDGRLTGGHISFIGFAKE